VLGQDGNSEEGGGYRQERGGRARMYRCGRRRARPSRRRTRPTAVGSQQFKDGAVWARRSRFPGTYRLCCTLHPLTTRQIITVR